MDNLFLSKASCRRHEVIQVLETVRDTQAILEIGPFYNPMLRGHNVSYFDVLSREEMVARLEGTPGSDVLQAQIPHIHYVSKTGDLSIVEGTFDHVISSHNIEHQCDLVRHLEQIHRLLRPGGLFLIICPDKRFCFDHFLSESNLAMVLVAHHENRQRHSGQSGLEHRVLLGQNDSMRHWHGDHGAPSIREDPNARQRVEQVVQAYDNGDSPDVHAWQFTPDSFRAMMEDLYRLQYISLRCLKVYPTEYGSIEFVAVLKKDEINSS